MTEKPLMELVSELDDFEKTARTITRVDEQSWVDAQNDFLCVLYNSWSRISKELRNLTEELKWRRGINLILDGDNIRDKLVAEVKDLRHLHERICELVMPGEVDSVDAMIEIVKDRDRLLRENEIFRKALQWYSDPDGWDKDCDSQEIYVRGNMIGVARNEDFGSTAEEALSQADAIRMGEV